MKISKGLILLITVALFAFITNVNAQVRNVQSINTAWKFFKGDLRADQLNDPSIKWETVSIPHSFNTHDVFDDEPGYYRGNAWYKKNITVPKEWAGKEVYLFFEGVNQVAEVYVNGRLAGKHVGGYTAFRFRVGQLLNQNEINEVAVRVNNEFNPDIPPLTADFTFFGGIYRDVFLEVLNPVHFNTQDHGADGVYVTTPQVTEQSASVSITGSIINNSGIEQRVKVVSQIFDTQNRLITSKETILKLKNVQQTAFAHDKLIVIKPELWSPEHPVLYRLVVFIQDLKTNLKADEYICPVAFRWYSFTADRGFMLNGKPYKIWGTSRHQDFPYMGNALSNDMHVRDVELLKAMGGNFLRVAHYPQDPAVLEACDRLGLLASVEIPVVNTVTESAAFTSNCQTMLTEMIRQNFNHPSVIMWAPMNEVLLRPPFGDDKPRQEIYFKNVTKLARSLDSLIRQEDPTRVTMAAFHGNFDLYKRTGLIDIPMVAGWNLYQGWYSDNINGFGEFLDNFHKQFPGMPFVITEYGADGDPRLRSFSPLRFDKSIEYETYYHQVYYKAIRERDFVSGGLIWNLADFSSETRAETMPHVNNKGIMDGYRNPKDSYFLYQSYLVKKPFLKIGSSGWRLRSGMALSDDSLVCIQPMQVFSNGNEKIRLFNNGKLVAEKQVLENVATFEVPFRDGDNLLEAVSVDGNLQDFARVTFQMIPQNLKSEKAPFKEINISLGDQRFFLDETSNQVWLPEKPYEKDSWGYVDGTVFSLPNKSRQQYGSDKNILGTELDAIYETQRVGIEQFRLDVPTGTYEIVFHFSELAGGEQKEALPYNLNSSKDQVSVSAASRRFNIIINGLNVMEGLGNDNYLVAETAYSFSTRTTVSDNEGIVIKFDPIVGEPILNGLQVRKVY
jgi:beta-galactosidase